MSYSRVTRPLVHATRFFSHSAHNLTHLTADTLNSFTSQVAPFPNILKKLQEMTYFQDKTPVDYNFSNFLGSKIYESHYLGCSATQLLGKSLPHSDIAIPDEAVVNRVLTQVPPSFQPLVPKMEFYIHALCDVYQNELAKRNYEAGVPDQENVSEREHALQAGKISCVLGLSEDVMLALHFHDVARPTQADSEYGHVNHHDEGNRILSPLKLTVDYAWYHAFAKFLLKEFCPPYQRLMSPVSQYSLTKQAASFQAQVDKLSTLKSSNQLASTLYKIMLMRLIDDMSKVPRAELEKDGKKIEYVEDHVIKQILARRVLQYCSVQMRQNSDEVASFERKIDDALQLMLRAREYTTNPGLYEKFDALIPGKNNVCIP